MSKKINEKQYKLFKARVLEYEKNKVIERAAERKETKEIEIQTDETPEYLLIESMNDMKDEYLKVKGDNEKLVKCLNDMRRVSKALFDTIKQIKGMLKVKQFTKKDIIQYCEYQIEDFSEGVAL